MTDKPHRGTMKNWFKEYWGCEGYGLGYMIRGEFVDHPEYAGCPNGHTSYVVAHDEATGEVETKNSRYTLVGPSINPASS